MAHANSLYALRVLRVDHDKLDPEARVRLRPQVAKSVQKRVDQVKQLGLPDPHGPVDPFNGNLPPDVADTITSTEAQP